MALKKMISRTNSLLAPLICLALVGYVCYLVVAQYRTQVAMQGAELRQIAAENAKRAAAISCFFAERRGELKNLAQSREVSAYFENQALGMSMEYGLRASIIMMDDLFDRTRDSKRMVDAAMFERIVFIAASGTLLADTREPGGAVAPGYWKPFLSPKSKGPAITTVTSGDDLKLQLSSPAFFKGTYAGQVVGWISSSQFYRHFITGGAATDRYPVALVFNGNYVDLPARVQEILGGTPTSIPRDIEPLVPYPLHKAQKSVSEPGVYAILVPVEGTPISLMTFIPPAELHDLDSPRRMLYTTGGIAIFMIIGMFYFQRVNTSNAVLQAHLEETTLREAAVDEQNRLLAAEIDERCQTELALRESEARFRAIVGALPVVIYVYRQSDGGPSFSFMSEKVLELAGVPAERVMADARVLFDRIHPEDREAAMTAIAMSVAGGNDFNHECRVVKPAGETRWIMASALPKQVSDGAERVWYGCIEDVTDRKQADLELRENRQQLIDIIAERVKAERLLRESEATLRSLMDAMPAGVWWFNEAGKVEYLNGRFAELFGYGMEEIPSVSDWFLHAYPEKEQREAAAQTREALIAEARRSGTPVPPQETKVTCRDGSVRHIIVNTQFCQGHTLEIFTDITQQEFINNELLKVQKMESLGVLAGGIAHDFNNILTGIMGNISFARMYLDAEHEAHLPLQAAEKASRRAAELAHQLLTFAKGGEPIKNVVGLRRLVAESLSLSLRGSSVQGNIEMAEGIGYIEADEGQIHQAFNNIAINAVHAMPGGGTLTVSGEKVLMRSNNLSLRPGPYVKLLFRDEGCGIDPAILKNIFDPYFTTKPGGTGLGLASTLSIIRRHGGHIQVDSKVGAGTTFTLYLPSTEGSSPVVEASVESATGHPPGGRVLVMDDEEMLRTLTSRLLTHLGYQVATCANGEEAIALYTAAKEEGTPFSAVIMDLTVPGGMGGKEAARHILAFDPEAKLIVSSGYSNDQALSEYRKYGFCGAVLKPYQVTELAEALGALLKPA